MLKVNQYKFWFLLLLLSCNKSDESNENSNDIPVVIIGSQTWMKKNLDVAVYRNGDPIPRVTTVQELAARRTGAWCYYENDPSNGNIYGRMYNWYAVNDSRGLAPDGWHTSTQPEWNVLNTFLGGSTIAGSKLKSVSGWNPPNAGADNSSGFTALPGGTAYVFAGFRLKGDGTQFWTSITLSDTLSGLAVGLSASDEQARLIVTDRRDAQYVRCVKN